MYITKFAEVNVVQSVVHGRDTNYSKPCGSCMPPDTKVQRGKARSSEARLLYRVVVSFVAGGIYSHQAMEY